MIGCPIASELVIAAKKSRPNHKKPAAGASAPQSAPANRQEALDDLAASVGKLTPMLTTPDMEATLAWYRSIGFRVSGRHVEGGKTDWASVTFGEAEVMFVPSGDASRPPTSGLSLWIRTERLDDLHALLKARQLERARAALAAEAVNVPEVRFTVDLYTAFYGQREFGIRDPNGLELMFFQPLT